MCQKNCFSIQPMCVRVCKCHISVQFNIKSFNFILKENTVFLCNFIQFYANYYDVSITEVDNRCAYREIEDSHSEATAVLHQSPSYYIIMLIITRWVNNIKNQEGKWNGTPTTMWLTKRLPNALSESVCNIDLARAPNFISLLFPPRSLLNFLVINTNIIKMFKD